MRTIVELCARAPLFLSFSSFLLRIIYYWKSLLNLIKNANNHGITLELFQKYDEQKVYSMKNPLRFFLQIIFLEKKTRSLQISKHVEKLFTSGRIGS